MEGFVERPRLLVQRRAPEEAGLVQAVADADTDDQTDSTELSWYHAPEGWHLADLPASLANFITTVTGTLFSR